MIAQNKLLDYGCLGASGLSLILGIVGVATNDGQTWLVGVLLAVLAAGARIIAEVWRD
jgi:hypothetical protein